MTSPSLFKWHHFKPEIIVCGVRWYLRYAFATRQTKARRVASVARRGLI